MLELNCKKKKSTITKIYYVEVKLEMEVVARLLKSATEIGVG